MKNFGDRQRQIEEEVKEQLKSDGSTLRRPEGPVAKTALEMNQQGNNEKENPMQQVRTWEERTDTMHVCVVGGKSLLKIEADGGH